MRSEDVRLGMPYRCWVNTSIGRLRARFVPIQTIGGSTQWGPVFLGRVYLLTEGRRTEDGNGHQLYGRFFADELDSWEAI